ncbi:MULTISPECIES: restriction endonuclease subunit S [Vibrio harveyi group]|uniref:restriction endonuclease subunit S n=1 Tax=Vibrio harveyi group TaxID=717610 RepID=UPI00111D3691|nr:MULTISPECIES: restriction endonuclease subunit S [Vibrio harveyi group]ELA9294490.1 restriction endonuclease subunit S [Vibrio parahaemolyticus]MCR9934618.1 restriction endonuclease subunit S [Vibrio antiquarius]TOA05762.1 restriction endonuclease subunit S [Vibrio parahaemolyticus]TOA57537.1 restriction endonuclease subunit S [Vibrio parahaemolyticus]
MDKTVGLACNISTGKLDANQAVSGGQYPFFTCAEFPDNIDHFAYDDDVVLVAGNNARGNFHVSRYKGKFNAYQRTYILTAKEGFNIDYIYYALKLELKRLRERAQGSQTKFLTMPILTGIHLRDVTGDEQTEIANVLSALDKKIELNNRTNAELEAMAKTLYDYWFVQFDFPDANGKPYKVSGGKMVYSDTLKREIPVGWSDGTLDNLGQIVGGSTPSTADKNNFSEQGSAWITPNDLSGNIGNKFISKGAMGVTAEGIKSASLKKYPAGTVLLSSRAPIGYMAIARNALTTNQGFKSFVPSKGYPTEFVYFTVKNSLKAIMQYSSGSTFKEVSGTVLKTVKIVLPPNELVEEFKGKIEDLFRKQDVLEQENEQLSSLRDWLLPMLMNGQVTVNPSAELKNV